MAISFFGDTKSSPVQFSLLTWDIQSILQPAKTLLSTLQQRVSALLISRHLGYKRW